jgi:hyaluronoglucosaminidase
MAQRAGFQRRGVVEGFFGPPWSMAGRKALFAFGARRGMNTYLYAPKDDPYHRERWISPYPLKPWRALVKLIRAAQRHDIDFVYGFHPGQGLRFSADEPVQILLEKAARFYAVGVRVFAVLFDDIPSRLAHAVDRRRFDGSLARAEGEWLKKIIERQPAVWRDVEWWVCPSYYSPDPLLARVFGEFEPKFIDTFAAYLPRQVACFWTGPAVVCKTITLSDMRSIARRFHHPLILWDNYPVNDLSMVDELHLGPLTGRDARLPQEVWGYLNNPLLQETLSLLPLATCLDYAADPVTYDPESSWSSAVQELYGSGALPHWRELRAFCDAQPKAKREKRMPPANPEQARRWRAALAYVNKRGRLKWARELRPWRKLMRASIGP